LYDTLHHWHAAVDRGQSVGTVFVDFAKAFDHVDHNVLISKWSRWRCLMSLFGGPAPSCDRDVSAWRLVTSCLTGSSWRLGLNKSTASNMQSLADELVYQATETGMIANDRKTKEMLM